jgi:hypothetical protein
MAGGSITVTVDTYGQVAAVAQRVLCWASTAANRQLVKVNTGTSVPSIVIPEAMLSLGLGALNLKRGGADLTSGYVAGTNVSFAYGNGLLPMQLNVNTCPSSAAQPNATSIATNVGGNPLATTLTYANVGAAGTVNIAWGDGTTTAGAAESGTSNHTYSFPGSYTITITDASSSTDVGSAVVRVP